MKRILLIAFFLVTIPFTACKNEKPLPEVSKDFCAEATIHQKNVISDDYILKAEISVEKAAKVEIDVFYPEDLSGLSYVWNEEGFEMVYDDLHCKSESDYLPEFTFSRTIYNVIRSVYSNPQGEYTENGDVLFTGNCESGDFELLTDCEGNLKNISVKEINFSADFKQINTDDKK